MFGKEVLWQSGRGAVSEYSYGWIDRIFKSKNLRFKWETRLLGDFMII